MTIYPLHIFVVAFDSEEYPYIHKFPPLTNYKFPPSTRNNLTLGGGLPCSNWPRLTVFFSLGDVTQKGILRDSIHIQLRQHWQNYFYIPFVVVVYSKRNEFAPCGSKFHPCRADPLLKWTWCVGKQDVTKDVSLYRKDATYKSVSIQPPQRIWHTRARAQICLCIRPIWSVSLFVDLLYPLTMMIMMMMSF